MTPPSPCRKRVVTFTTLSNSSSFRDRNDTLASSARPGRVAATTLSGRLQTRFCLWSPCLLPWPPAHSWPGSPSGTFNLCASWRTPAVMIVSWASEKGGNMARRKHSPEQVINKLRQAEVAIAEGCTVAEASRQIGVTQQTFYRWRA